MANPNQLNNGPMDGDEVVQIYVRDLESSVSQPVKSLRGFKRVHIGAGESETVQIPLAMADLGFYDVHKGDFIVEPGMFKIQAGASSADIRKTVQVEVK